MNTVVFWDFDGTLAFREGLWGQCLVEVLDAAVPGHGVTRDVIAPLLIDGFPWHEPDVAHPHLSESGAWWGHINLLLSRALVGAGIDSATAAEVAGLYKERYLDCSTWGVFEDTEPALRRAADLGRARNVILSNHVPELTELVDGLGLGSLVDDVITSATTGYEKPHPGMYGHALDRAGRPAQAWMIGDNPLADVIGAERAGLNGILVRANDHPEDVGGGRSADWRSLLARRWPETIDRGDDRLVTRVVDGLGDALAYVTAT